jgi:hypothetical protein
MKFFLITIAICYVSSIRITQRDISELSINNTALTSPINERNLSSSISISPGMNMTGEAERERPLRPLGRPEGGPFARPIRRPIGRPSERPLERQPESGGRMRFPHFNETVTEGPIWSNRSLLIGQPPVNPEGFWSEKYRIIPPQFWDQNLTNAVIFVNNDGRALSCEKDGDLKLLKLNRESRENNNHLWFPEILSENIIRLRSYHGGYLSWDVNKHSLTCDSREKNFLTRWEVLLQISESKRNQCLFLQHRGKFLGFHQKKLVWENWTGDHNKFCFFGMPTSLTNWHNKPRYIYSFDPSRIFGRGENISQ